MLKKEKTTSLSLKLSIFGLVIGIISIIPTIYGFFYDLGIINYFVNKLYLFTIYFEYNQYVSIFLVSIGFFFLITKTTKIKKISFILLLSIIVINILSSIIVIYNKDYSYIINIYKNYNSSNNIESSKYHLNNAQVLLGMELLNEERILNNKSNISQLLYLSFIHKSKNKDTILSTETICKAIFLDEKYKKHYEIIINKQNNLDKKYNLALDALKSDNENYFLKLLEEIDSDYENYGYSRSFLNAHYKKSIKHGLNYHVSEKSYSKFKTLVKSSEIDVKYLTNSFRIENVCYK